MTIRTAALWMGWIGVVIAPFVAHDGTHPLAPYAVPFALIAFSAAAALCDIAKALEGRKP